MSLRTSVAANQDVASPAADSVELHPLPLPRRRAVRPCGPADPLLTLVYHDLDRQFDALQIALSELNCDDSIGAVHRARNATRRLRGTLKVFRDLLPDPPVRRLRSELSWLAEVLGGVRDLDVHRARLDDGLSRLPATATADLEPYLRHVEQEHSERVHALEGALASERFARLSAGFAAFLDREPSRMALRHSPGACDDGAAEYAVPALRKLRRTGRRIDRHSPPEELHRLRIRCKRLRYQLESFEPAYGDRLRRVVRNLKRLQDSLGVHLDATVAAHRLRAFVASDGASELRPASRRAVRQLSELEAGNAKASLKSFRHDWKRFEARVRPKKLKRKLQ